MDNSQLLNRLRELEDEINDIKSNLEKPRKNRLALGVQKLARFCLSYWALLSLIFAVIVIIYVQLVFGVDYFENYREISTKKRLSEFYLQLGDQLLEREEFDAAKEVYKEALQIDVNNAKAAYGAVKAQVFQPIGDEKYYAAEVVDARLDYLLKQFPDDYQVDFLKGIRYWHRGDVKNAQIWTSKSIEKHPRFAGGYVMLGYITQNNGDIQGARKYYEKAVALDPENPTANGNLGSIFMLLAEFDKAYNYLKKSYDIAPSLDTQINLGDYYLYEGDIDMAKQYYDFGLEEIEKEPNDQRFIGTEMTYNFMPLKKDDTGTTRDYVRLNTVEEKKLFLQYRLSVGYAMLGNFESANKAFDAATILDKSRYYSDYFAYYFDSVLNFVVVKDGTRQWLQERLVKLVSN